VRARSLARAALRRLTNAFAEEVYLRTGFDRTRPTAVQATVNERCNYRCRYCGYWRKESFEGHAYLPEMSIEAWQQALEGLRDFLGRYLVEFLGGEPFLKEGFVDLLEFCRARGIDWSVCTNGAALSRPAIARRVVEARPFHVDLSVDSADAETNDWLRGVPGGLRQVERAVANLRAERKRNGWRFPIRIKPVVTRQSFRRLPELVEWTSRAGADSIDPSPVRPWTREVDEELWIREEADLAALAGVVDELLRMKAAGHPIETPPAKLRSFVDHFRGVPVRHGVLPCRVGLREFLIRVDGEVEVCWFHPPIGNVQDGTARELWRGDRARRIRRATVRCKHFGSVQCANSCLAHKTVGQEIRRGFLVLRRTLRRERA